LLAGVTMARCFSTPFTGEKVIRDTGGRS